MIWCKNCSRHTITSVVHTHRGIKKILKAKVYFDTYVTLCCSLILFIFILILTFEFQNLTEFNTAHNRRITVLGITDEEIKAPNRKRKSITVHFQPEEEIINPGKLPFIFFLLLIISTWSWNMFLKQNVLLVIKSKFFNDYPFLYMCLAEITVVLV